jgi:lipopolysaccharide export system protein LptC
VQAKQGAYHRDLETLQLAGGVDLVHDQGYEIRTPSANVDLTTKTAEGNEPVAAKGPFGELSSQGFRVTERGAIIEFTGKSRLVLVDQPEGLP